MRWEKAHQEENPKRLVKEVKGMEIFRRRCKGGDALKGCGLKGNVVPRRTQLIS